MSTSRRTAVFALLACVILAGGHLRLQSAIHTVIEAPLRADAGHYFRYAQNLVTHGIYSLGPVGSDPPAPDAVRSPGYPLFLAPFVRSDAREATVLLRIHLVQALLGTLAIGLAFLAARGPCGDWGALAVATLVAASPHLVVMNSYVLSEALFAFLLAASVALAAHLGAGNRNALAMAAGVFIGLAALTRPWLQYFVPVLWLWAWLGRPPPLNASRTLLLTLGFLLVFGPWVGRNLATLGAASDPRLTINGLHHGMYPDFTYAGDPATFGYPYRFDPESERISASVGATLTAIAGRFAEAPATHLRWYLLGKPLTLFSWSTIQGAGDVFVYTPAASPYFGEGAFRLSHRAMKALHAPLMALAAAGALFAWLPLARRCTTPPALFTIRFAAVLYGYFVAVHLVTAPFPRYAVPMRPIGYLLAIFTLAIVWRAWRSREKTSA